MIDQDAITNAQDKAQDVLSILKTIANNSNAEEIKEDLLYIQDDLQELVNIADSLKDY